MKILLNFSFISCMYQRSYEIVFRALFVCGHDFVQFAFMQVCIFYRFFWRTSFLSSCILGFLSVHVKFKLIFINFITFVVSKVLGQIKPRFSFWLKINTKKMASTIYLLEKSSGMAIFTGYLFLLSKNSNIFEMKILFFLIENKF